MAARNAFSSKIVRTVYFLQIRKSDWTDWDRIASDFFYYK